MKIKAVIFGATGMVGEGALHETLKHGNVESVLVIGRRTGNIMGTLGTLVLKVHCA